MRWTRGRSPPPCARGARREGRGGPHKPPLVRQRMEAFHQPSQRAGAILPAQRALPDHLHGPTGLAEGGGSACIPGAVPVDLGLPVGGSRCRDTGAARAGVPMPPATMDEHHRTSPGKHDVWTPGETVSSEAESQAGSVQSPSHNDFRRRVARPHARHGRAARGRRRWPFVRLNHRPRHSSRALRPPSPSRRWRRRQALRSDSPRAWRGAELG